MRIRGYEEAFNMPLPVDLESTLADGWETFDSLPLVAAHLAATEVDEELLFGTLGVEEDTVKETSRRLTNGESWPTFRVPLRSGDALACVYRNLKNSENVDFLVEFKDTSPAVVLASIGEGFGPALSWPELHRSVYEHPLPSPISPDVAFLLFLPFMKDEAAGDEAVDITAAAISNIGGNENSRELAAALFDQLEEIWYDPIQWNLVDDSYLICTGQESPRRITGEDPQTLARITQALA